VAHAPDAARSQEVGTDGVRLNVRRWAGGPNGALLIHGLASSSHIWDLVAPRLGRLGIEPVAYDQRGHGRSTKPSSGYGFEHTAADAAAVIRATGLRRPIVVGHSWGANVALELAVRHPRLVSGAILLDGGFSSMRDRFDWRTAKRVLSPPAFGGITVEAFVSGIPEHTDLAGTPEIETVVLSLVRVDGHGRVHPRLARANHLKILHALWAQDTDVLLRRVRVPTLVLAARTRDVASGPGGSRAGEGGRGAPRPGDRVAGSVRVDRGDPRRAAPAPRSRGPAHRTVRSRRPSVCGRRS
jgi:pimeloyl-ACP methyl ester carboxylesterase